MGAKAPLPSAVIGTRSSASSPFPLACGIPLFPPPSYAPVEHRTPMAGVSFYCDGVPLDSPPPELLQRPLSPIQLRHHRSRAPAALRQDLRHPRRGIPAFESLCSDRVERWVQRFLGESGAGSPCCRRFSLFPDLRRRIEALTHELLSERMDSSGSSDSRKRKRGFEGMLMHLQGCAVDPFHSTPGGGRGGAEWLHMLLRARHVLFLHRDRSPTKNSSESESDEESRARKRRKGMPIQPQRRSLRIAQKLKINEHHPVTTSIGIGSNYQADVLEWTGPPDVSKEYLDDSRWLGTKVWPVEGDDEKNSEVMVGRGRPETCACTSPGSVACVKSHVSAARLKLRSDLGQAFFSWGFDEMGEDVSKLWIRKERKKFESLERLKSGSRYKTFWQLAESCFPSKSGLRLLNYYFNVFIPRRMSRQSRLPSAKISSDNDFEDDNDDKKDERPDDDDDKKGKSPKMPRDDDYDDRKSKSPKRAHDDKKGKSSMRPHDDDDDDDNDKKGKSPKGQSSESKSAKGLSPQSKSTKGKSAKGQSSESKSAKGQSPKGKSVGSSGSRAPPRSRKSRKKT